MKSKGIPSASVSTGVPYVIDEIGINVSKASNFACCYIIQGQNKMGR
jgi:hypothetical protein